MDCLHSFLPLHKENFSKESWITHPRLEATRSLSKNIHRKSNLIESLFAVQCIQCGLLSICKNPNLEEQATQIAYFNPFFCKSRSNKFKDESSFSTESFFSLVYEEIRMNSLLKSNLVKKEVTPFFFSIRPKLLGYLEELVKDYEYTDRVLFHAIYIIDYFYSFGAMEFEESMIEKENHFYVVLASFMLSVKFVENDCVPPKLSYFDDKSKSICGKRVNIREIYQYEMVILELLQYKLDVCTIDFIIDGLFYVDFSIMESVVLANRKILNLTAITGESTTEFKSSPNLDYFSETVKERFSDQIIDQLFKLTKELAKRFLLSNISLSFSQDEIALACLVVSQELVFAEKSQGSLTFRQAIKVLFDTSIDESCVEKVQMLNSECRISKLDVQDQ